MAECDKTTINITINLASDVSDEEMARRIIKVLQDYRRKHGGQDPAR